MQILDDISRLKMFEDIAESDIWALMRCLKIRLKKFDKNEVALKQYEQSEDAILLLKGSCVIQNMDLRGNICITGTMNVGDAYGIESSFMNETENRDSVVTKEKCQILFIDKFRLVTPCNNHCRRHDIIIKNITKLLVEKNIELIEKLTHLSQKNTREKLISYLTLMSAKANSNYFEIPYNKTELANYLSVDRSAMSTELKKLKDEGVLDFYKKEYKLLKEI